MPQIKILLDALQVTSLSGIPCHRRGHVEACQPLQAFRAMTHSTILLGVRQGTAHSTHPASLRMAMRDQVTKSP